MVIHPGDITALDYPYMLLSSFRWTALSTDAFDMFSGHRDVTCWGSITFYKIASLDTTQGVATAAVLLRSTLNEGY
jgi:hypothetical protein